MKLFLILLISLKCFANISGAEIKTPPLLSFDFTFQSPQNKIQETLEDMIKIEIGKETFLTRRNSNIFSCGSDSFGNSYCPSNLAKADSYWDYESGFSVGGLGQVVDYSDKTIVRTCKQVDLVYSSCAPGWLWIGAATNYCANLTEGGYTDWRMPQLSETSASQNQGVPSCGENTITGTIRSAGYSYVWHNRTSGWGENAGRYGGWGWKVRCVR